MELRHLRAVAALAEHATLTRAAAALGVTHQALSQQLREAERELGVPLADRRPGGVVLTAAGEEFAAHARETLAAHDRAVARARQAAARPGPAVASVELGFASGLVAAAVRAAEPPAGQPPPVRHLPSLAQWDALRAGALDLGLVYTAPPADDPDLERAWLFDDPLSTALVPVGHPCAGRDTAPATAPLAALGADVLLVFPRTLNPGYHDRLAAAFARAGFVPRAVREVPPDGSPAWALVARGEGWTLEPASYAASPPPGTAAVRLRDFALPFGLWVVWRRGALTPAVAAVRDALLAAAAARRDAERDAERGPPRGASRAPPEARGEAAA